MSQLVFVENNRPVTDSLIIAEAFGKEHARVLRDIRELGCSDEFRVGNFAESVYSNEQGRDMPKYIMTEQGFAILAMGYNGQRAMEFKEKYISEFHRMREEMRSQPALPKTFVEALKALLTSEEEKIALMEENKAKDELLELQSPKVALYDTAMSAKNNQTIGSVAKTLGIGRNKLFDILREQKILMKSNLPYQEYIDRGYFDVRQYSITHMTHGIENKTQTLVTPKGVGYIHKLLQKQSVVTV